MGLFKKPAPPAEVVIDLREPARPEFGKPTRCPQCSTPGYLDRIDIRNRVMHQRCPSCWHRWTTAEDDLVDLDDTPSHAPIARS